MSTKIYNYVKTDYYNSLISITLSDLFEEIKYTLDDEMLDEFITTIKGNKCV